MALAPGSGWHLRYRVPGYPITPLLFIAAAAYVVIGSIASNPANALKGTLLLLVGVPVFFYWRHRTSGGRSAPQVSARIGGEG